MYRRPRSTEPRSPRHGILMFSLACLLVGPGRAEAQRPTATGYVTATSDYVFRGISQTYENPAFQGGLDVAWKEISVFGWASNVDFGPGETADAEIDIAAAWNRELTADVSVTATAMRILYVGDSSYDYTEVSARLGIKNATLGAYVAPHIAGSDGTGYYVNLGYDIALPREVAVGVQAGRNWFADAVGATDYWDTSVVLSRSFGRLDLSLAYMTTDLAGDLSDDRLVGSATFNIF